MLSGALAAVLILFSAYNTMQLTPFMLYPICRYFVFDALDELQQHGAERRLNDDVLQVIYRELRIVNPFARELRTLGRELTAHAHPDPRIRPRGEAPTALRLTSRTNGREIGAVVMPGDDHHYDPARPSIMIHLQDQPQPPYLKGNDPPP